MNLIFHFLNSSYTIPTLVIIIFVLLFAVIHIYHKLSVFTRGENGKNLESVIREYLDKVDELKKHDELIAKHALEIESRLSQCIRNVSTVRFKAFDQNSSNQSFAISLLNEHGDGVIISSLHHRDRVSIFAKPIVKYISNHDLTEEEINVLEDSKKSHRS